MKICEMQSKYYQVNLQNMLEELGKDRVETILSGFSCPQNEDVEYFLKRKAILFSQQGFAKTFLVFWCSADETFDDNTPLPSALHDAAMQYYRQYLVVGGMPECVMQFVQTQDYILVRHTQDTILSSYLNDMSKYNNLNEIKKTRLAYDNITVQLSKRNTRFQYKLIKKGGRAAEFENAIEWLCLSGIVSQVHKVEQVKKPLENYRDIDAFKIYVSDLGLLCAKKDLMAKEGFVMHDWMDFNRDGEVDWSEKVLAAEMLCTSREEHNALFGDDGDFDNDAETDDADFEYDAIMSGLDPDELMDMDEDERDEALEDAGLDPDDYDF